MDSNGIKYDRDKTDFLNGIAYNAEKNTLYVTGKYWPALLRLK
jgi:glutamine cyclotransferase